MIPATITLVDEFPKTPNGKIDRGALPQPNTTRSGAGNRCQHFRDEVESKIAAVFQEALQAEHVDLEENLFDLGVHSLLAMQVANRLQRVLGRPVHLIELFQYPTVRTLAAHFREREAPKHASDPGRDRARKRRESALRRMEQPVPAQPRPIPVDTDKELMMNLK
ncbi:MAG: hypothetical protein HY735_28980 [Verrucomicrobia bacterium]|nr:hypothetical protein [Verrucomicrobiota bacterium]